jgi:G3E family GTPase
MNSIHCLCSELCLYLVAFLLRLQVEQIECADFVVLNKVDLLEQQQQTEASEAAKGEAGGSALPAPDAKQPLDQLVAIVATLNPLATVVPASQGKVCMGLVQA